MTPEFLHALGLAFTGEALGLSGTGETDGGPAVEGLAQWFAAVGWPVERLQALREQRQADDQPWPFVVDPEVIRPLGFARFLAVQKQARAELGLDGLHPTVHHGPRVIGAAEQRLLAEVPPHHGNVG